LAPVFSSILGFDRRGAWGASGAQQKARDVIAKADDPFFSWLGSRMRTARGGHGRGRLYAM
jgi:hypothetical protein